MNNVVKLFECKVKVMSIWNEEEKQNLSSVPQSVIASEELTAVAEL
jgi:hypothetical protein